MLYRAYYYSFEAREGESLQGLAFFFGLLFIVEVGLWASPGDMTVDFFCAAHAPAGATSFEEAEEAEESKCST